MVRTRRAIGVRSRSEQGAASMRNRQVVLGAVLAPQGRNATPPLVTASGRARPAAPLRSRRHAVTALSTEERGRLLKLGTDLEVAWRHPQPPSSPASRIIRVVLRELYHPSLMITHRPSRADRWT